MTEFKVQTTTTCPKLSCQIVLLPNYDGLPLIKYQTELASGLDLYAAIDKDIDIGAGSTEVIPTGIKIQIPPGYEGQLRSRSGWAIKNIVVGNSPGTIDGDFRGEVMILLSNRNKYGSHTIKRGDRIAQLVICPIVQANLQIVESLEETQRGGGGFGSTGFSG